MALKSILGLVIASVVLGACSANEPFETPSPTPDEMLIEENATFEDETGRGAFPDDESTEDSMMYATPSPDNDAMMEAETQTQLNVR